MGTLGEEHTLNSWYYPPKSHNNSLPGALYSLEGFKCLYAAISRMSNGLPQMERQELKEMCDPEDTITYEWCGETGNPKWW